MSQHDYVLENQSGALFRQDLNNVLKAIAENNMGATAPTTTYAGMWWLDISTSPATLRIRNNANDAWVSCGNLNEMRYLAGVTSGIQAQLNAKAALASPALTGVPTAPTPTTGDRTTKIATTALFDSEFTKSLAVNGYQKLPSGLIMQWGAQSTATNTVVFPISFPNICVHANWTYENTGFGNQPRVTGRTKTGFNLSVDTCCSGAGSQPAAWFAIGY